MIAGDHGPDFVAEGVGAGCFFGPPGGRDDELVGGQHELCRDAVPRFGRGLRQQPPAALAFGIQRQVGQEHVHRLGRFSRRHERRALAPDEIELEVSGTPEIAARLIAAALLDRILDVVEAFALEDERRVARMEFEAQRRHLAVLERDLVLVAD